VSANNPFLDAGDTVNIVLSAASQAIALTPTVDSGASVRVVVIGTETAFLNFGDSAVVATAAAGMPVMANSAEVFAKGSATHVAAIGAVGSTVYLTTGAGN
jgi:hypothetical protein